MPRLTDRTGLFYLTLGVNVRITHPRHLAVGSTGSVVRIDVPKRRVWIKLPDGRIVPAGHRSVEVIDDSPGRANSAQVAQDMTGQMGILPFTTR